MGILYRDLGQIRIVNVQPDTSIAEVVFSCDYMQRGDVARPFVERPAPPYKDASKFDIFAPANGKPVGTVVTSFDWHQALGAGITTYVNIGASKGVKVGDYVRFFRYQTSKDDVSATAGEHGHCNTRSSASAARQRNTRERICRAKFSAKASFST